MMNKDFELKMFVFLGGIIFLAILAQTRLRDKKRPQSLLCLFLVYVFFQCLNMIEFFPLTAFQMFSFPEENVALYYKFRAVREDGSEVALLPHRVLPMLADGRVKRYAGDSFENPSVAAEFARAYSKAYDRRIRKQGEPGIKEVHLEKWKWDFFRYPDDPERGYRLVRVIATPEGRTAIDGIEKEGHRAWS